MKKFFILILSVAHIISNDTHNLLEQYNMREPHYPSYVDRNHYGFCLRAVHNLPAGTIVATADFEACDNAYVANHPDPAYKYVALTSVAEDGSAQWGRIRGKWAFCNHSCDPNCDIKPGWFITTNRFVKEGEELTTSYDAYIPGFEWPTSWNFTCLCEAKNCKKFINGYRMDMVYPLASNK